MFWLGFPKFELKIKKKKNCYRRMKEDFFKKKKIFNEKQVEITDIFLFFFEVEVEWLHWLDGRSTKKWVCEQSNRTGCAGWIDGQMQYEVHSY